MKNYITLGLRKSYWAILGHFSETQPGTPTVVDARSTEWRHTPYYRPERKQYTKCTLNLKKMTDILKINHNSAYIPF